MDIQETFSITKIRTKGVRHTGHSNILRDELLYRSAIPGKNRGDLHLGLHATKHDIALAEVWRKQYPEWWQENMAPMGEIIRFVDGGVRIKERFLLRDSFGRNIVSYNDATRRIEGFAPISKYLECFRCMPSGGMIEGDVRRGYLQGEAIKELGKLLATTRPDYWSSTPCPTHEELAWCINFELGYATYGKKHMKYSMGYVI